MFDTDFPETTADDAAESEGLDGSAAGSEDAAWEKQFILEKDVWPTHQDLLGYVGELRASQQEISEQLLDATNEVDLTNIEIISKFKIPKHFSGDVSLQLAKKVKT